MKSFVKLLAASLVALFLTGCGSGVVYAVKPTPIKADKSTYTLAEFNLDLDDSDRDLTETSYLTQEELAESFKEKITAQLKEQGAFGEEYKLKVDMFYDRVFNVGGHKLNKPQFFYTLKVYDQNDQLLASYSIPKSTTKYSYFKEIAVNMEIGVFKRDAEDEPEDIELISKTIVKELKQIGD